MMIRNNCYSFVVHDVLPWRLYGVMTSQLQLVLVAFVQLVICEESFAYCRSNQLIRIEFFYFFVFECGLLLGWDENWLRLRDSSDMEWVSGGVYILKGWMMQMNYMRELTDRERERERGVSGRLCLSVKTSERLGRCGVFDQL